MSAYLSISVLGKLQIELNNQPVTGFVSSKAQALLCYLAVTGLPHARESLATLLWGDMPDTEAKANLRNALSNLRKLVGEYLVTDRTAAAFNRNLPYRLDVTEFEAALSTRSEMALDTLQRAVDLYKGDFLAGFVVRDALDFEDWQLAQRERWRHLALQALLALVDGLTAQGDYNTAIDFISRLLALDPTHEEGHRRLMKLLARTGRRSEALARYHVCRQLLAEQLGVEPTAETTALYNRLKQVDAPPSHNLPPQLAPFFGRKTELAQVTAHLNRTSCRMLTLIGPGGTGKTRLAIEAAGNCVQDSVFRDGVFFVSMPVSGAPQPEALAAAIGAAIGFTPPDFTRLAMQLLTYLQNKEMLLLLDDVEPALAPDQDWFPEWLATLLHRSPGIKLLVTSRERLNVQEEWPLQVGGLDCPSPDTRFENLANYSAVGLFLQQARQARSDFEPTPADVPAIIRLCYLVDGMPLALQLAAAWLHASTPTEIAAEIEQNLDFLTSTRRNAPTRHRSLRAVFDQSWQRLTEPERVTLRQLSVFQGGFSREAAREVVGASLPLLAGLVDKSLLRMSPAGRYDMHELLRQYAAEKLARHPQENNDAFNRHAHYYAGFIQRWRKQFERDRAPEWLAELNAEVANLRLGWQRAIMPGSTVNISHYWYLGEADQIKYLAPSIAAELHPTAPELDEGQWVHMQGVQAFYQGNYPLAQRYFTAALQLFSVVEDVVYVARAQVMLGQLAYQTGDDTTAETLLRQGMAGLKAAGDHRYRSYVLVNLALLTGDIEPAKAGLQESLALNRTIGSGITTAHILKNLGRLALAEGEFSQAHTLLRESVGLFREQQELWGVASTMPLLGQATLALNDYSTAEAAFLEALRLGQQQFEPLLLETLVGLAELAHKQGHTRPEVATWLSLAANHPAARRDTRQRAEALLPSTGSPARSPADDLSAVISAILEV